jgi:hypothetical protein
MIAGVNLQDLLGSQREQLAWAPVVARRWFSSSLW